MALKKGRGGKREGSGRKRLDANGDLRQTIGLTLTQVEAELIRELLPTLRTEHERNERLYCWYLTRNEYLEVKNFVKSLRMALEADSSDYYD